jgi:hypothetical protein
MANLFGDFFPWIIGNATNPRMTNHALNRRALGRAAGGASAADGPLVEIVNVEEAEVEPGVTAEGLKEQDESDGRPEEESVTGLLKGPNDEPTLTV